MDDWKDVPMFGERPQGDACIVRPSVYARIEDDAGRIAIVRTPQGVILPGGGVEADETQQRALEREVLEECGLVVAVGPSIGRAIQFVFSQLEGTWFEKRCTLFTAEMEMVPSFEPEIDHELLWAERPLALDMLTHESQRWALELSRKER